MAASLGFPVVAKVSSSVIVHKSDVGGVRVGIESADAAAEAFDAMMAKARAHDPRATMVVQQQATAGTEVILGATRDGKFGPLLMFGLGGIFVEVMKDVVFRIHPLSDRDANDMIRSVKSFPLLDGARGRPKADLQALEAVILRLDALMAACPDIAELDINPLFAGPAGTPTAAADARVSLS